MISRKKIPWTVGERLRRFLAFRGQSLRDFADAAGIPYSTLQNYVGGSRRPAARHLAKMAQIGLDVHWLLTGKLRPPIRLDWPGEDWGELADKIGAFSQDLQTDLFELAFDLTEQFAVRYQERQGEALTVRQGFSAFSAYYWLVLRSASRIAPLVAAATKSAPKSADLRAMVAATITPELDATVENSLRRLL